MNGITKRKTHGLFCPAYEFHYDFPPTTWRRAKPIVENGFADKSGKARNRWGKVSKRSKNERHPCLKFLIQYNECIHKSTGTNVPVAQVFPLSEAEEAEIGSYLSRPPLPPPPRGSSLSYQVPYTVYKIKGSKQLLSCNELLQQLTECSNQYKQIETSTSRINPDMKTMLEPFNVFYHGKLFNDPSHHGRTSHEQQVFNNKGRSTTVDFGKCPGWK